MKNLLRELWQKQQAKRYTPTKLRDAMLIKNAKFLKKAYLKGQNYIKRTAVTYLGELPSQENYAFLLQEMKSVQDLQIKSYIYSAILNMAIKESIQINDEEANYLDQNFDLLENIGVVSPQNATKKEKKPPINFRDKLRNHHELLREMQKSCKYYSIIVLLIIL